MSTFTNNVAVITGGNSGIGLAAAKESSTRAGKSPTSATSTI
jgi:NAD(P)-dependent dehydrogenase (short-subunit alcohol dehydrogenase family)